MSTIKLLIYQNEIISVLYNPLKTKKFIIINCLLENKIKSEEYYSMKSKLKSFFEEAETSTKTISTMVLYCCPVREGGFSRAKTFSNKEELQFLKRRVIMQGLL